MIPPPPPPSFDLHHLIVLDALFSPFFVNNFPYFGVYFLVPTTRKKPEARLAVFGPRPDPTPGGVGVVWG